MRITSALAICLLAPLLPRAQVHQTALSPEEEMKTFQLEPGLAVDLVAAEPLVVAPVAMSFDEKGRMFVAENRGYPLQAEPPIGRIALLEDKNEDGRFETRHDYVKGLTFPNGVLSWDGGVIVTCAPEVLFFKDLDGDGKADQKKVLLRGFSTSGSTQLRVSHPTFAPDNWVYLSGGLSGGSVTSPLQPGLAAVDISRQEIRFRPDTGVFEGVDGKGQFGLTFDEFGNRFTCMNRVQIQHVVIAGKDLERNPNLAFTDRMQDVPEGLDPGLKVGPAAARLRPISRNITTADSHEGFYTAACAVTLYDGTGLPEAMRGSVFSCDPAANLVHRDKLIPHGATFRSAPATQDREFLASTDDWFRPVFLQTGPDGALYICDMYRKTIEHPEYLPEEVRKRTDFESGRNTGRIYRVRKASGRLLRQGSQLREFPGEKPVGGLFVDLMAENRWQRETAQRQLRAAPASEYEFFLRSTVLPTPEGRLKNRVSHLPRVLYLLHERGELSAEALSPALESEDPLTRRTAVKLSRQFASPELSWAVLARAFDPDPQVRFECALALPANADTLAARSQILREAESDRWTWAATLSSASGLAGPLLAELLKGKAPEQRLFPLLGQIAEIARKEGGDFPISDAAWQAQTAGARFAILNGWLARDAILPENVAGLPGKTLLASAAKLAGDITATEQDRGAATRLLRFGSRDFQPTLAKLLALENSSALQREAVDSLLRLEGLDFMAVLRAPAWSALSPSLRERFLSGLVSNPRFTTGLLDAVDNGEVNPGTISPALRGQLRKSRDTVIRERSEKLFASNGTDRQKVYEELKDVVQLQSNPRAGQEVFARACSTCHRLDRVGTPVGPDLFSIRNQPKEATLLHIIAPDLEITSGFNGYMIETKDGRELSGIIRSETDTAITVRTAAGQDEIIPRSGVAALQASQLSMMPRELEKTMTRQELADLLAYLKGE